MQHAMPSLAHLCRPSRGAAAATMERLKQLRLAAAQQLGEQDQGESASIDRTRGELGSNASGCNGQVQQGGGGISSQSAAGALHLIAEVQPPLRGGAGAATAGASELNKSDGWRTESQGMKNKLDMLRKLQREGEVMLVAAGH